MKAFGFAIVQVNEVNKRENFLEGLLDKYSVLFNGELGRYKHKQIHLSLKPNSKPVFFSFRTVPYAFRQDIDKQIVRLEQLGVISPVPTNDWGTPLVPIVKPDGSLRICADYKITINKFLDDDKHPLPRVIDILNALEGGVSFTTLDLEMAYNQLELDEESRKLVAWSTHRGVYLVNRLAFGVKTATGIFQREMEVLLQGISGVFVFIDDIVITGRTHEEHLKNLEQVFHRLSEAGLRLKRDKCKFFQNEIKYLGHTVNKNGVKKTKDRTEAILQTPQPTNITEVRAFAGLVNYYGRFIKNIADIMCPIYNLLKKNEPFEWNNACSQAFEKIKRGIAHDVTLSHFNPDWPIILETDASEKGIGGALSHKLPDGTERPIAFFSRTLTVAENNYPTIQKEALAIVESTKKFFDYLIGTRFTLRTDHKPLVSVFGEHKGIPTIAAARMQRWALFIGIRLSHRT